MPRMKIMQPTSDIRTHLFYELRLDYQPIDIDEEQADVRQERVPFAMAGSGRACRQDEWAEPL